MTAPNVTRARSPAIIGGLCAGWLMAATSVASAQIAKPEDFPAPAKEAERPAQPPKKKEQPFKPAPVPPQPDAERVILTPFKAVQFRKDKPEAGPKSSESAVLREDAKTGACELLVRLPAGFRLPPHWHSANQTHAVIRGRWSMSERNGPEVALAAGAFNFTPGLLVHEGRNNGDEPALLLVTFDGNRDQKLVETEGQPPRPLGEGQPHLREKFLIVQPGQARWTPLAEGLAAEAAVLHQNKATGVSSVLVRAKGGVRLPRHWHTAGAAGVVLSGSLAVPRGGESVALDTGSYCYFPPKLVHEATAGAGGVTMLVTTDGAWDVHWVEDPAGGSGTGGAGEGEGAGKPKEPKG